MFAVVVGVVCTVGFLLAAGNQILGMETWGWAGVMMAANSAGGALIAWRFALHPSIALDADEVVVRNPLRTTRFPVSEITGAEAGWDGVQIERSGRRAVTAFAVQKSRWATWSGWHTRADDVAAALREAGRG